MEPPQQISTPTQVPISAQTKPFWGRMAEFVEDNSGGLSSMRLLMLMWGLVTLFVWATLCFMKREIVVLDTSVVQILAILTGGKVCQRFGEKDNTTNPPTQ